jgi:two-component system response regulator AtoC
MSATKILVVDDQPVIRGSLAERFRADGHDVVEAENGREALDRVREGVDLVLLACKLPDVDGVTVLWRIKEFDSDAHVILLTAHASVETTVEAMKIGADHATRPFNPDDVALLVERAIETTRLRREVRMLRASQAQPYALDRIVGESPQIQALKALLAKVAASPASTVLLTGERGTGKDLAARVLHFNSARAHRPFINVTCSPLAGGLLENELFGHERGSLTDARQQRGLLESADGGTVFLDEIGDIASPLQARLLRLIEEKTFARVGGGRDIHVDIRVIAATSRSLEEDVRAGRFRSDLFYRLYVQPIPLPPLRAHAEDVPALVTFFVDSFNREFRKNVHGASSAALNALQAYDWPGNIRELRNVVERAVLLAEAQWLQPAEFRTLAVPPGARNGFELPPEGLDLEQVERSFVVQALDRCGGNQTRAAVLLGMNRDQIRYRIEKFGLARPTH